jgi:DNA-directed RNA polymerase subunit H (RpoH/RPB5)
MATTNHQIRKDNATVNETVITNIVKMLAYRGWVINEDNSIKKTVEELFKSKKEEKIFTIKLNKNLVDVETYDPFENKKEWKNFNGDSIIVYLSNQKVTGKSQILTDFIAKYNNYHKIIIVDSITEKIRHGLSSIKYTEVFKEVEFMLNITDHVCCPQHTVLSNKEFEEFLKSYNIKRKEMPKQFDVDPMSRYLYLKRGQAIRIVRNSEMTGQSVFYRIIVHKVSVK